MTTQVMMQDQLMLLHREMNLVLSQLEEQLELIRHQSTGAIEHFRGKFGDRLNEWSRCLENFKKQMVLYSEDLSQSESLLGLKTTLNHCENYFQEIYNNFQGAVEARKVLVPRHHLQWARKIFHTSSGLFGLWLYGYSGLSEKTVILILSVFVAFSWMTEVTRYFFPKVNQSICFGLAPMMRESERTRVSSATWYMLSTLVVFLIFPKLVGMITLFYVGVGDTIAGIVGVKWGRHRLTQNASFEGTLAFFVTCFLGSLFFLSQEPLSLNKVMIISFLGSSIATLAEMGIKKLDDNLVIPLISAPSLWVLLEIFC